MNTIATRIMEIVNANGGNKSDFARKIGVTPAYISKLGKNPDAIPSDRTISDICRVFRVNETWLRTGTGTMENISRETEIAEVAAVLFKDEENSFRSKLISVICQLSEDELEILQNIARELVQGTSCHDYSDIPDSPYDDDDEDDDTDMPNTNSN